MKQSHSSLILVLAIAFFLRVLTLNQSYWLDEAINVSAVRDYSLSYLVTQYSIGDFHPPLYHILLKPWVGFFGHHEVATRMLSVVFGLITVYYTWLISKQLFANAKIKITTFELPVYILPPLLLSTSALHVYYSGEARMYSLAAMGVTASMYYLLCYLDELKLDNVIPDLTQNFVSQLKQLSQLKNLLMSWQSIGLILGLWVLLMSDYVPWMLIPLFFVLAPIHTLIALLAGTPWVPIFIEQLQVGLGVASDYPLWGKVVGGLSLKNIALIPIKFMIGRTSIDNQLIYGLVLAPIGLTVGGSFFMAIKSIERKSKFVHYLPHFWFWTALIIGVIVSAKISLLSYFRFLFVLPAFYLVLIQGIHRLNSSAIKVVAICFLLLVNVVTTSATILSPKFQREDWRGLSQWIDQHGGNAQAIAVIPSMAQAAPYLYYQRDVPIVDTLEDIKELPNTIFLIRYVQEIFDPQDQLRSEIEDLEYVLVEQRDFNGVVVWHYQRTDRLFAWR